MLLLDGKWLRLLGVAVEGVVIALLSGCLLVVAGAEGVIWLEKM